MAPVVDVKTFNEQFPVLGVCYGAQLTAKQFGGRVEKSNKREYGRAQLQIHDLHDILMEGVSSHSQVWMSHGDSILSLPDEFEILATTESIPVAAFRKKERMDFLCMLYSFIPRFIILQKAKKLSIIFL